MPARPLRTALLLLLALATAPLSAQERFVIEAVVVTDDGVERMGTDVTALITNAPGKGRVVLLEQDGVRISAWVRTNTHHVGKGSTEPGTLGIAIELEMVAYGHREKREMGRTFRPNDERTWHVSEKFLARTGRDNRRIVVAFTGRVE